MHAQDNTGQNSDARQSHGKSDASSSSDGKTKDLSKTKDLREASENIRKARGDDATDTPVETKRTGNRPRFDRDR